MRTAILSMALGISLPACGASGLGPVPADCQFPDGVPLAYAGETTLGEVGLAAPGGEGIDARVWITAEPIVFEAAGTTTRVICAQLDDGSVMLSPYPVPDVPNEGGWYGERAPIVAAGAAQRLWPPGDLPA